MWEIVRNRKIAGVKFRRQAAYGRYVLDFYSKQIRLAIEIDGASHAHRRQYDKNRDETLLAGGIETLRIRESDVLKDPNIVRELIVAHMTKKPENNATASQR